MENLNLFEDPDLAADNNLDRDLFYPVNDYNPLQDDLVSTNDFNFDPFVPMNDSYFPNHHTDLATNYVVPDYLFAPGNDYRLDTLDWMSNPFQGQKSDICLISDTEGFAPHPDSLKTFSFPTSPSSDRIPNPNYNTVPTVPWKEDCFDDIDIEWSDRASNSTISDYSGVPNRNEVAINIEPPQNAFEQASSSGIHIIQARNPSNPTLEKNSSQFHRFPASIPPCVYTASYSNAPSHVTSSGIDPQDIGNPSGIRVQENHMLQRRLTGRTKLSHISREEIMSHFNTPIVRAAKTMNVGLTALKMRCRQVGIDKWPQRKIRSLDSLISTVKESGNTNDENVRRIIVSLEEKKKQMLENPQVELTDDLRKMRQTFFKLKYMKKRGKRHPYQNRVPFVL